MYSNCQIFVYENKSTLFDKINPFHKHKDICEIEFINNKIKVISKNDKFETYNIAKIIDDFYNSTSDKIPIDYYC